MDTWSRGRVTLVGDAGYSPGPAVGGGTTIAVVGAYVLAGELHRAGGEPAVALRAYEDKMREFVRVPRAAAGASSHQDEAAPLCPGPPDALHRHRAGPVHLQDTHQGLPRSGIHPDRDVRERVRSYERADLAFDQPIDRAGGYEWLLPAPSALASQPPRRHYGSPDLHDAAVADPGLTELRWDGTARSVADDSG